MTDKVADFFWQRLTDWGVHRIYGYPGDGINALMGAMGSLGMAVTPQTFGYALLKLKVSQMAPVLPYLLLVLMLTSKGIAGVPRASLVVVLATCSMFNIPPEGIALILPIDHFCDMFRTMTNVMGNALATSAVSKWEGELQGGA